LLVINTGQALKVTVFAAADECFAAATFAAKGDF
jgi:hypothetical protein